MFRMRQEEVALCQPRLQPREKITRDKVAISIDVVLLDPNYDTCGVAAIRTAFSKEEYRLFSVTTNATRSHFVAVSS